MAEEELTVHVGVDAGGTNTDAVVISDWKVIGKHKHTTTDDVTSGVKQAIWGALQSASEASKKRLRVERVHIGTTHFVNAVVQRQDLARVAVIRLCGPASTELPPFSDFPPQLHQVVGGPVYLLDGGHHFDGRVITPLNEQQVLDTIAQLKQQGIKNVVVSGIFSPSSPQHEDRVGELFTEHYPEASVTLSHTIAQLNLLLRENAAVLNESLRPLGERTVLAFRSALAELGLGDVPYFLTQNDGTLISAEESMRMPVHTFACGVTNSMRGAAFLSGVRDGVVVDIGGTSTDCGMLVDGFPRPAAATVKIGGVRTNFRMPDVHSIGLGGGSYIKQTGDKVEVGPQSVASLLERKALVFGGDTLTASDIAVAARMATMGTRPVDSLDPKLVAAAVAKIREMVEDVVDQMKTSADDIPVVVVGGGSVLIDGTAPLRGSGSAPYVPRHHDVVNAVGAALAQVAGTVDRVARIEEGDGSRERVIAKAKQQAEEAAVKAGARRETVKIVYLSEVPLTYVPGNATRVCVKAVGDLAWEGRGGCLWVPSIHLPPVDLTTMQERTSGTGGHEEVEVSETEPDVDPVTGEWSLSEWDLHCMAVGAGILGCGGGGNPHLGMLLARRVLRKGKKIRIITPDRLAKDPSAQHKLLLSQAMMGAPTIFDEIMPGSEPNTLATDALLSVLHNPSYKNLREVGSDVKGLLYVDDVKVEAEEEKRDRRDGVAAILCLEIGGANSMTALVEGGEHDIPVLDADAMGRAFPELQHCTPLIYGFPPYPAALGSIDGKAAAVLYVDSPKNLENHFRMECVKMGCLCGCVLAPMEVRAMAPYIVPYSYSRAYRLGAAVLRARSLNRDPVHTILEHEGGKVISRGKIVDVERKTTGGFARGLMKIEGFGEHAGQTLNINFQNENLIAKLISGDGTEELLACTPDLISCVVSESGAPLATEELRYGLRVAVLVVPASHRLRTPAALAYVGPQGFGYAPSEVQYRPLSGDASTQVEPVALK